MGERLPGECHPLLVESVKAGVTYTTCTVDTQHPPFGFLRQRPLVEQVFVSKEFRIYDTIGAKIKTGSKAEKVI